jgi:hypothetical protein
MYYKISKRFLQKLRAEVAYCTHTPARRGFQNRGPLGHPGPDAVKVVEFLVSRFAKLTKRARLDGLPQAYIIGNYRARLRAAIGCAAARGFGKMLNRATAVAYGAR